MSRNKNPMEQQLTRWQRWQLNLLWGFSCLIAHLPHFVRYHLLQPLLVFALMVIRYRRGVILSNLERSFPEKRREELLQILYDNYRILAEVIIDTISLAGVSSERKKTFIHFRDLEPHKQINRGRDWIALASHYGCWEYFMLWSLFDPETTFLGVYHPLRSPVFDCFYNRLRNFSDNVAQVPMYESIRYYLRNRQRNQSTILGLIADQNPKYRRDIHWFRFLNQDTVFFDGAEKLALRFHLPVYFCHIKRVSAGRYELWFEEIYDGESDVEPNTIMERYVRLLEQMITQEPSLWLWSHRRWKHKRKA